MIDQLCRGISHTAIHYRPKLFENMSYRCSPMVVSMADTFDAFSEPQGVQQYQELIDLELLKMDGFVAAEMTPHLFAARVKMPVLMFGCLDERPGRRAKDRRSIGKQGKGTALDGVIGWNHCHAHPHRTIMGHVAGDMFLAAETLLQPGSVAWQPESDSCSIWPG